MQSKWEIQQRLMKLSIRQVFLVRYYLHNHLQNYYLRAPTLQTSEIYNKFEDDYGEVPTEKDRPSLKNRLKESRESTRVSIAAIKSQHDSRIF